MKINSRLLTGERGTALIATLMFLLAMGVLSTALVFTVQNEMKTSTSYRYGQQAFYVADAGVQTAIQWFSSSGNYAPLVPATAYDLTTIPINFSGQPVKLSGQSGNFPNGTVSSSFASAMSSQSLQANSQNSGTYNVTATLLKYTPANFINPTTFASYTSAMERWKVNSTGTWGDPNRPLGTAQITAVVENSGNALFDKALWGIDYLDLGGTVLVDSYDPALGAYGGTNIGDNGAVGSNGVVSAGGAVEVHGDVAFGPSGSFNAVGNPTVTGDVIRLPEPRYFPPIPGFSVGSSSLAIKNKESVTINPGSYKDINIASGGALTLNPGTYYFDSIISNGEFKIAGSLADTTTIFVKSAVDLGAQGVTNPNGDPTRLNIYYSGTSEMKLAGGPSAFVEVYAPNAPLKLVGTSDFFGSFIGKNVTIQGTPEIHFDEGCLQQNLLQRPFRLITWSKDLYQ